MRQGITGTGGRTETIRSDRGKRQPMGEEQSKDRHKICSRNPSQDKKPLWLSGGLKNSLVGNKKVPLLSANCTKKTRELEWWRRGTVYVMIKKNKSWPQKRNKKVTQSQCLHQKVATPSSESARVSLMLLIYIRNAKMDDCTSRLDDQISFNNTE